MLMKAIRLTAQEEEGGFCFSDKMVPLHQRLCPKLLTSHVNLISSSVAFVKTDGSVLTDFILQMRDCGRGLRSYKSELESQLCLLLIV